MRKRNDAIVSESVTDGKRGIGSSKLEMSNSISMVASTTMSLSAGTVSIYGKVVFHSIPEATSESKILYISDSGNISYNTGMPLSKVLSASNSTGANDIFFLNDQKLYSTYAGLTSSYIFTNGTSMIRSVGERDYSEIYSASQSSYMMTRKYGTIEGKSTIRTYNDNSFTYADMSSVDMSPSPSNGTSESYIIVKNGRYPSSGSGKYGSASVSIGAKIEKIGYSDDREAKITLKSDGFMYTDLGNQNYFNTKFSSSAFATDLSTGSQSIATITWNGSSLSGAITPLDKGEKVAISVKAWVLGNYDSPVPGSVFGGAYHAEHFALFLKTASGEMTMASINSTEASDTGFGFAPGSTIRMIDGKIAIEVNDNPTNDISFSGGPIRWRVHYEYIVGDYNYA